MPEPSSLYSGPRLVVLEHNPKVDSPAQIMQNVNREVSVGDLKTIATWQNDKPDGELTTTVLQGMQSEGAKLIDLQPFADRYNMTKTHPEQGNMRLSGAFTQWTFAKVVDEVEDIIEEKKMVKHSQIQKRMESLLDKDDQMQKFRQANPKVDS